MTKYDAIELAILALESRRPDDLKTMQSFFSGRSEDYMNRPYGQGDQTPNEMLQSARLLDQKYTEAIACLQGILAELPRFEMEEVVFRFNRNPEKDAQNEGLLRLLKKR